MIFHVWVIRSFFRVLYILVHTFRQVRTTGIAMFHGMLAVFMYSINLELLFPVSTVKLFLVGVQPFSTTLFGMPFPHPTPQGRWVQQHRKVPEICVLKMHMAAFRTTRQHWQTYKERMPRNATRPKGQAVPPHKLWSCAAIDTSQPFILSLRLPVVCIWISEYLEWITMTSACFLFNMKNLDHRKLICHWPGFEASTEPL